MSARPLLRCTCVPLPKKYFVYIYTHTHVGYYVHPICIPQSRWLARWHLQEIHAAAEAPADEGTADHPADEGTDDPALPAEGADDPAAPVLLACFPMNPLRCWSGEDEFAALIPAQS